MKRNKKIIFLPVILAVLIIFLSLAVSAENAMDDGAIDAEFSTEDTFCEDVAQASGTEETFFDELYGKFTENADKIFAALAFVGTMVVSFAYRKGLIPLLSGAMSTLKGSVDSIRENGTELTRHTEEALVSLCEKVRLINDDTDETRQEIKKIDEKISEIEKVLTHNESLKVILASQIDMLYAIFMSSSLPQYQKEEVGCRINAMREELQKHENFNE